MSPSFIPRAVRLTAVARLAATTIISGMAFAGCSSTPTGGSTPDAISPQNGNLSAGTVATVDGTPLVVLVNDANGVPVSGVQVSFVATGGLTLSATTATTNSLGQASVTATFGTKAGQDSVTASAAGLPLPAIFTLTANAAAPSAIVAQAGSGLSAPDGSLLTLSALVTDQYGNPVPNVTVDWSATAGLLTTPATVDSTNGIAQDILNLPATPTAVTVTATIDGTAIKAAFLDNSM